MASISSLPSPTSSSSSEGHPTRRKPRVTAEHTLNRVRENQRRHRARRKDLITTLEEKLAETEKQLAEARREIATLRAERDAGPIVFCDHDDDNNNDSSTGKQIVRKNSVTQASTNGQSEPEETPLEANVFESVQATPQPGLHDASFLDSFYMADILSPIPLDPLPAIEPPHPGPPPCCEDEPVDIASDELSPSDPASPECSTCHERPAPSPLESTTLCAQAYVMIQQQNFRGIDATTIRLWLYQGYRRAQRDGEGCRVENGALFRLLDYISGL